MRARRGAALAAVLGLAACASPNPDFFTLAALPGPRSPSDIKTLELRRIGLAGYLDRSEIVRATTPYRLHLSDTERWGEPLGQMVGRVLTEDLVGRLPNAAVFAESGAISTQPDEVLEVDLQRFDADSSGQVVLLAQVAVRHDRTGAPAIARTIRIAQTPASPATADLVAAMSKTLGAFADQIAAML
jgi:uncharacterized lipoprotein YmbA